MAAFVAFKNRTFRQFHVGQDIKQIVFKAVAEGADNLELDGEELGRAQRLVEAEGYPWQSEGSVVQSVDDPTLIPIILLGWNR